MVLKLSARLATIETNRSASMIVDLPALFFPTIIVVSLIRNSAINLRNI